MFIKVYDKTSVTYRQSKKQRLRMGSKGVDEEKIRASIMKMVTRYAERGPFFLNPDRVVVENVVAGLLRNKMKHGYAYCPCRGVEGIPERDRGNICPCRTHKEDIARQGTCECGLFVSRAFLEARQLK